MTKRTAVFPGSFNPFTIGHKDIVDRALKIFDQIVIVVGINIDKETSKITYSDTGNISTPESDVIRAVFRNEPRVSVILHQGLTAALVKEIKADCIIRGVRSASDFEYEKSLADVNLEVLGIDTLLFPCRPALSFISSSMVRELNHFSVDTSPFIPKNV